MAYNTYEQPKRKIHFSKKELQDLLIAMGVITIAFAISFSGYGIMYVDWALFPLALLISFLAVGSGFILHELGHKFVANRYGAWAEFRAWVQGLTMAFMFALLFGFVFAAPGAVYIAGNITKEQNGKISVAGPLVNLSFAAILFPLTFILFGVYWEIIFFIYYINAFLAVFNLVPIYPLDGEKIVKWNVLVYILVLGSAIGLLVPAILWFSGISIW
ncbi:MAG: site-2 protease family protein [Candidatus Helarchaeota archaeon]|nr:site-2 protease family protein [Candidatus Helarchaeota archaeon]